MFSPQVRLTIVSLFLNNACCYASVFQKLSSQRRLSTRIHGVAAFFLLQKLQYVNKTHFNLHSECKQKRLLSRNRNCHTEKKNMQWHFISKIQCERISWILNAGALIEVESLRIEVIIISWLFCFVVFCAYFNIVTLTEHDFSIWSVERRTVK